MSEVNQPRSGPPLGRHVAAVGRAATLTLAFLWIGGPEGERLPLSRAVLADVSLVLLCLILVLGAVARLVPRLRTVAPWGRELGIGMFVTAGLHVAFLLPPEDGVFGIFGFLGEVIFPERTDSPSMWTGANWVGALALGYALLAARDCSVIDMGRSTARPLPFASNLRAVVVGSLPHVPPPANRDR